MASDTHDSKHTTTTPTSSFQKTVCLQSWWLVKAEENNQSRKLAVAGFTSREQQAVRLFSSAPILKRYDVFTLETEDGVCVVIQGLIDKARTEANGFPTEVFQHFVFGFPSYWEECAEKFLGEESTAEGLAGNSPGPEKASPQSGTLAGAAGESIQRTPTDLEKATSEKTHGGGPKKNLREKIGSNMDEQSRLRSGVRKCSVVPFPQDSEAAVSNVDGGSEMLKTLPDNKSMESLTPSKLKRNAITPSISDMNVIVTPSNSKIRGNDVVKNFTDHKIKNPILSCRLSKTTEPNSMPKVCQKRNYVRAMERLVKQLHSDFNFDTGSPDEISSHCSGRVLRSSRKLKGVKKDDQVSARVLEKEKGVSVSVSVSVDGSDKEEHAVGSVDSESGNFVLSDAGNQCLMNQTTPKNRDSISSRDDFVQNAKFFCKGKKSKQDQNHEEVMNESSIRKGLKRAASASKNSTSVKRKVKTAIGRNESFSKSPRTSEGMAKRKLAYETPVSDKGDEQVPTTTPESMTFKRSRSGRALLRTLEYWRNERAIFDEDRRITGIKTDLDSEHPYEGSRSEPPRKRVSLR